MRFPHGIMVLEINSDTTDLRNGEGGEQGSFGPRCLYIRENPVFSDGKLRPREGQGRVRTRADLQAQSIPSGVSPRVSGSSLAGHWTLALLTLVSAWPFSPLLFQDFSDNTGAEGAAAQ